MSDITTSTDTGKYNSVLSLANLTLNSAGTYTCDGKYSKIDGTGAIVISKAVEVVIRVFKTGPSDHDATAGSTHTISCTAVGDQEADMSW